MPIVQFSAFVKIYDYTIVPYIFLFSVFLILSALFSIREATKPKEAENLIKLIELDQKKA